MGKTSGVCGRIERNNKIKDKIYKFKVIVFERAFMCHTRTFAWLVGVGGVL
jgi:hypothetical protein